MSGSGGRAMNDDYELMRVLAHDDHVRQFISARISMHKSRMAKEVSSLSKFSAADPHLSIHYSVVQTRINLLELDIGLLESLLTHSTHINQQG